jgi:pimeloyl-ACP methyl ester carboxylesterase
MQFESEIVSEFIHTNGITLHVITAGNKNNPLVILLHGFPEFWKGWEKQIDDFVKAGYYVMVPDQRGYNLSDKPRGIGKYRIDKLAKDVVGLIDHVGKEKAIICGHDWGAGVAWRLGMQFRNRIDKIVIVNVPHTSTIARFIIKDREQRRKSSYMFMFQIPLISQWLARRKEYSWLVSALKDTSNEGTFSDNDIKEFKEAWSKKRAITCMLNWYRAAFRRPPPRVDKYVDCPLLIVWGENDRFLKKEMGKESLKYCNDGRIEYISETTHWVLHEKPEIVNQIMIDFLGQVR